MTAAGPRASPVRDRLIGLLRATPRMTTAQIAERMGRTNIKMYGYLARQHVWGYLAKDAEAHAEGRTAHESVLWRLPNG